MRRPRHAHRAALPLCEGLLPCSLGALGLVLGAPPRVQRVRPRIGGLRLLNESPAVKFEIVLAHRHEFDLPNAIGSAQVALGKNPTTPQRPLGPRYFLLCHSIELALKAFLLSRGMTEESLRRKPYGHSLVDLREEADSRGLAVNRYVWDDIVCLSEAHFGHWARYVKKSSRPVFVIDQFEQAASELLDRVRAAVFPPI